VSDPDLDQSVVELDFIERIAVDGTSVEVDYRLPTFWCSANFAWIMSEDMRRAVEALDWVDRVSVRLVDHFAAEKINNGIAGATAFGSAFETAIDCDLDALRGTFRKKSFLGRMSAVVDDLRTSGWDDLTIADLTIGDLQALAADGQLGPVIRRFLELRDVYGGPSGFHELAFRTPEGKVVEPAAFANFLRDIRMTRRGVEANGEMCRILLESRTAAGHRPPAKSRDAGEAQRR